MFSKEKYIARREKLKNELKKGLLVFIGNAEIPYNYKANTNKFRQDSSFLYLFGIDRPNLAAIMDIDNNREIIFGDEIDLEDIIWTGPLESLKEQAEKSGIKEIYPFNSIYDFVSKSINNNQQILFLPPYHSNVSILLSDLLSVNPQKINNLKSQALIDAMVKLRSKKDEDEIVEIEKMLTVAQEMHVHAMYMAKAGITEKAIAGAMEGICLSRSYAPSFPVICSVRGEVLHNTTYNNILQQGQLLLCDAGAESYEHYASDITRTFAVNGTMDTFQKEIFQIVLNANLKVKELAKPGIFYRDVHLAAAKEITKGLKALNLLKGDIEEIVNEGAHALFFPHGVGHLLGLDVHDMESYGENNVGYDSEIQRSTQFGLAFLRMGRRLQEGFVVTDEPGIYFIPELVSLWEKENKFKEFINYNEVKKHFHFGGIRIEDDILITNTGCRLLGEPIPYSI